LGIGDWGLGIGPNPQSPIPNPQSPIPNFIIIFKINNLKNIYFFIKILLINLNYNNYFKYIIIYKKWKII